MLTETPIIQTKLHRPPVIGDLVPRPHLLARLNKHWKRPLTLVSAPAGYGKTTLISSWLDNLDNPDAWVSLDEHDDDLASFLTYFLAAVDSIFPQAVDESLAMLKAPELPPVRVMASSLINNLAQIDQSFLMVLDDFHTIRHMDILDLVNNILRYPPPNLHLVLITRSDPPLNLIELKARSHLLEIRGQDLRFNEDEVRDYLQLLPQIPSDPATTRLLNEKSEGWVTGLRLLTLSMRNLEGIDWTSINHLANNHLVEDYLMTVILNQQEPAFMECLLKTSILDRFCPSLCTAVCESQEKSDGWFDGDAFIDKLVMSNLFIIPLDTQNLWFRYHHLFQDLLLRQLENRHGKAPVLSLHGLAGRWYADNGYVEQAIRHLLTAGKTDDAAALVAEHRHELMNQEQFRRLDRWLQQFPDDAIEQYPELLMTRAWVAYYLWYDLPETMRIMDIIDGLPSESFTDDVESLKLKAESTAIRSQFLWWFADADAAIAAANRVLENTPLGHECVRSTAMIIVGGSLPMKGEFDKGESLLKGSLRENVFKEHSSIARILMALCFVYWVEGKLDDLLEAGRQLAEHSRRENMLWSMSYAYYFLGVAFFERNDLTKAEEQLSQLIEKPYLYPAQNIGQGAFALALTYQAIGKEDKAEEIIHFVSDPLFEKQNALIPELAEAIQVELELNRGKVEKAIDWTKGYKPGAFTVMHRLYLPELIYAKALLVLDTVASRKEAGELLSRLEVHTEKIHNLSGLIRVLVLQAVQATIEGDESDALAKLERALRLGESGTWIRPFVDFGPRIVELLLQLKEQGIAVAYLEQILTAIPERKYKSVKTKYRRTSQDELAEALTARELDVLNLLAQQLTNKEIAAKLVISAATVRNHTHNIYQKLFVKNRMQAVSKALELNLLPDDF